MSKMREMTRAEKKYRPRLFDLENKVELLTEVIQNQKEKLCHMSFSINRAEAFIDFLLSSTKFIPTPEEVREINQVAIERTNAQFPSMPIQLILDGDKAREEPQVDLNYRP